MVVIGAWAYWAIDVHLLKITVKFTIPSYQTDLQQRQMRQALHLAHTRHVTFTYRLCNVGNAIYTTAVICVPMSVTTCRSPTGHADRLGVIVM